MCGICGVYEAGSTAASPALVRRMQNRLVHRGPDDQGEFYDGSVGLGFRRLSILDLEGGRQPMSSPDGRVTIVFNGEIYNHPRLRRELEEQGAIFRTRSDTETILQLYLKEGAEAFRRLDGMFALAVWDALNREIVLARDPLGIKPLFYCFDGRRLVFASELRALLAGGVDERVDTEGLSDYLSHGKVFGPRTIFRGAMKLLPGHFLRINDAGLSIRPYWTPSRRRLPASMDVEEAREELDRLLGESVGGAMLSDVPLGAFLSGGLDSSLLVAYMARHSQGRKVRTFSLGFRNSLLDESAYAREVSRHLGTEHEEIMVDPGVLDRFEDCARVLDEPIADSAILPTYLLAQGARRHVKVVLTGEGSDELFAGYNRYKAAWLNEKLAALPPWVRRWGAVLARRLGRGAVFDALPFEGAADWVGAEASNAHRQWGSLLRDGFKAAVREGGSCEWIKDLPLEDLGDALTLDLRSVLCDALLPKVDQATMKASLEARVPYLNKPVVEYGLALASGLKIRRFKGKYLLRKVAERHLPRGIVWRRKHGFLVPWEDWVRSPDNRVIHELLSAPPSLFKEVFDMGRLSAWRGELVARRGRADAGLFFRLMILGLWMESLEREKAAA